MDAAKVEVRPVPPEVARPFRRALLRPNSPPQAWRAEDALPGARHYGAFLGGELVATGSVHPEAPPFAVEATSAWRLKGMVVRPDLRGRGVGALVLRACLEHARASGADLAWCDARVAALSFYRRHGFVEAGEPPYDDPEAGPHLRMMLPLSA